MHGQDVVIAIGPTFTINGPLERKKKKKPKKTKGK